MNNFCVNVNAQSNGDHEVHNTDAGCRYLPAPGNRIDLGLHSTCRTAVAQARHHFHLVNGCAYCAWQCHTS